MTADLETGAVGGLLARLEWRCFHCDEVFTDRAEAHEHFGDYPDDSPLCLVKGQDGGLAARIRELEAEVLDAYKQRNEYENDARLWHEAEADRVRRIGQVQWWQELDSREGERLYRQVADKLRSEAVGRSPQVEIEQVLVKALERIRDNFGDCGCEHDDENCCALVTDYECPSCLAFVALRNYESVGRSPQPQAEEKETDQSRGVGIPAGGALGSTASNNELIRKSVENDDEECPNCDRGLRGSFPLCIDCQLVEALKNGD